MYITIEYILLVQGNLPVRRQNVLFHYKHHDNSQIQMYIIYGSIGDPVSSHLH